MFIFSPLRLGWWSWRNVARNEDEVETLIYVAMSVVPHNLRSLWTVRSCWKNMTTVCLAFAVLGILINWIHLPGCHRDITVLSHVFRFEIPRVFPDFSRYADCRKQAFQRKKYFCVYIRHRNRSRANMWWHFFSTEESWHFQNKNLPCEVRNGTLTRASG